MQLVTGIATLLLTTNTHLDDMKYTLLKLHILGKLNAFETKCTYMHADTCLIILGKIGLGTGTRLHGK